LIAASASLESAESYANMANGSVAANQGNLISWLQRQTFLALQAMILGAIDRGIDSCPMEGFNPQAFSEILGLTDVVPTALLTLGYASAPGFAKIRVPLEDIVDYRT
jgi:nitroreductase